MIFNRWRNPDLYGGQLLDMVTAMSLVSSAFLIVLGGISACIIKGQAIDDLEITLDVKAVSTAQDAGEQRLKKTVKKIHSRLGLRASISRELALVFGVDETVIEVPRINRTMHGCKVRLFMAKTDTLNTLNDLRRKVQDVNKVLSLLFRCGEEHIEVLMIATSSDQELAISSRHDLELADVLNGVEDDAFSEERALRLNL